MPYLKYTWEFVEVFCKESHKKEGNAVKIDITGDEFKKWVYAKWDIAPESNMKKYNHPAMFPEELVKRLLKLFSYQDDIVLVLCDINSVTFFGSHTALSQGLSPL